MNFKTGPYLETDIADILNTTKNSLDELVCDMLNETMPVEGYWWGYSDSEFGLWADFDILKGEYDNGGEIQLYPFSIIVKNNHTSIELNGTEAEKQIKQIYQIWQDSEATQQEAFDIWVFRWKIKNCLI